MENGRVINGFTVVVVTHHIVLYHVVRKPDFVVYKVDKICCFGSNPIGYKQLDELDVPDNQTGMQHGV